MLHFGAMDSMDEDNYALTFCTLNEAKTPRTVLDKVIEQSQATKRITNILIPLALTCKGGKAEIDYDTVLSQAKGSINKHWLLLDNQSTVNGISNGDLLTNTRQIDQYMHIYCNAGKASTNWVGDLDGVGTVWFHNNGIVNILSLSLVKELHRVTFDSAADNVFKMYGRSGDTYRGFRESPRGL